jgi:hypothetical protein
MSQEIIDRINKILSQTSGEGSEDILAAIEKGAKAKQEKDGKQLRADMTAYYQAVKQVLEEQSEQIKQVATSTSKELESYAKIVALDNLSKAIGKRVDGVDEELGKRIENARDIAERALESIESIVMPDVPSIDGLAKEEKLMQLQTELERQIKELEEKIAKINKDSGGAQVRTHTVIRTSISKLTDVDLTGLQDGYVLAYNASEEKWTPVAQSGGGGAVDSVNGQTGTVVLDADDISDTATTNRFTTASDISKLAGIESGATADQTGAEIKAAYEGEANTNAFTDAEKTKLSGVESGATADQSNAEIEAAYNTQVAQVSAGEKTAGTETGVRRFSPQDVADMASTHGGGSGDVSKVGTPANNQVAVWTGDGTLEGESEITYDGTVLTVSGQFQVGSTPNFVATRAMKLYDDGVAFGARASFIATNPENAAIEFVHNGNTSQRALIRFWNDSGSDYGYEFFTTDGGSVAARMTLSGAGNLNLTSGNITLSGTVDGRDVAADGAKLDGVESGADVTDETNVVAALNGATLTDVGTPASTDRILLQDASDSNNLKYADFSEFGGGGGGAVDSVNGQTGVVVLDSDDISEGATNKYASETNVVDALDGATLPTTTVATDDKILIQDTSDSNNIKTVTTQSVADLSRFFIVNSGRVYCYTDNRWITDSDDVQGLNAINWNESGGTGVDPIVEWEHMGIFVPAGYTVVNFHLIGRANNNEVTDIELYICERKPNPITRWETGVDADGESTVTVLYRDLFENPTGGGSALTGNMNDRRRRTLAINHDVTEDAYISLYMKPTGTITATRYWYLNHTIELQRT